MWGAIIGAALGLAGGATNAILGAKERRKQERYLDASERENQAWYDRHYNADAMQQGSVSRLVNSTFDALRRGKRSADATGAVMGSGDALGASVAESSAKAIGDMSSQILAQQDRRRDAIESAYMSRNQAIRDARMNQSAQKSADLSTMATNVASVGANVANAVDTARTDAKTADATTATNATASNDGAATNATPNNDGASDASTSNVNASAKTTTPDATTASAMSETAHKATGYLPTNDDKNVIINALRKQIG